MVQYLINATLIWAICLFIYELLLKRETYHSWNRWYLVTAIIAGLAIPFIPLGSATKTEAMTPAITATGLTRLIETKSIALQQTEAIVQAHTPVNWLMLIYMIGFVAVVLFMLRDVIKLINVYRKSTKARIGKYILVETNQTAGPYSFFNLIFIDNIRKYTRQELDMILQHEYRHAQLKHGIDLLIIHVLQALLWFHPFIYVFKKRLQLVHEYQADEIAKDNYTLYGNFLVEQTLLYTTPIFTHSFYHSPIKNRIIMLTKNASATSHKAKYLLAIPMLFTFMLACTHKGATLEKVSHEKVRTGNKETFKGNVFEYAGPDESVELKGPNGEVQSMIVTGEPIKINGEQIYKANEVTVAPKYDGDQSNMVKLVFNKIKDKLNTLGDGEYHIALFTPIIDKKGNFAYYFVRGIEGPGYPMGEPEPKNYYRVGEELQKELVQEIETVLDAMKFKPAQLDGKAVNAELDYPFFGQKIIVKNHQVSLGS